MNDKRLTILTLFGTRPELIKVFPVLEQMSRQAIFQSVVVSSSQHREMIDDLLELFALNPHHDLNIIRKNQSLSDISLRALEGMTPILTRHRPDMVLVQGDTTTAFIGALSAFYQRIPVGHIEAGLRSFDNLNPYPEEINRRLISLLAAVHFTPTERNAENLYREGIDPSNVFVTGNTVIDCLLHVSGRSNAALSKHLPEAVFNSHRIILVTAHRRENWGKPLEDLCRALKDLVQSYSDIRIVFPVHLNPMVRETVHAALSGHDRIHLTEPLLYEPFVAAMSKAYLIITDSGGIQEEGPSLGKPVLVFRKVTERPEGITGGGVKLVGVDPDNVLRETARLLDDAESYREMVVNHNPYGDGKAAERILQAILHRFELGDRPENFKS